MSLDQAETIALQSVAFLASDEDSLADLLHLTGLDFASLKTGLANPDILAGVLAILLQNEQRLLAFCAAFDIEPSAPAAAHHRLAPLHSDF
ncbi:DUF3572 family protein [Govanella unica]|uniref:DUF3572 domain-containing protein n=1 Tax=Govanella unica TaxID=2975056 RepID=A0A9X3Z6G7_9PROT|nr:DUF3572 family protein [Govania unica]MDA5193111.1 DUF3572 domain-containing protein [Govania unica]